MDQLSLNDIREKFLKFYESKGHLRLPSFPLVPQNDDSLLLINAGMAPLKPYFTGKETPPCERVVTCQKCIRTPDIERVGKTARHGTFFEMLGNFSFGDYFKKEAIAWAWEFVTKVLCLPAEKLWITIYQDDDEAFDIWANDIGIEASRIVRMGKEDNFWEIGTGPCGPCSEIHFDRGAESGCGSEDCKIGCDCDRFVEFWNLVFTQFDRDEKGNYNRLAKPNIDTGMGLERIAAIMQGVSSLFEVDTVKNITEKISGVSGVKYGNSDKTDISLRVITDHVRSTVFLISDNVAPSNEGRGYVLRRLLRRAARHGKLLGINKPFLYKIADTVIDESKSAYPELSEKRDYIKKIIKTEEERFDETIDTGLSILAGYLNGLKQENQKTLSGKNAFKLYDTYGFPIDLTIEIAGEQGFEVDEEGFADEMEKQRIRARSARKEGAEAGWSEDVFQKLDKNIVTEFAGYDKLAGSGRVLAIVTDGEAVNTANDGENAVLIFDKTVFYGESGGQAGDTGRVFARGFYGEVYDTKKLADGKILHFVNIKEGSISSGDTAELEVCAEKRHSTERNHSATHILHKALHQALGDHITQAGSLVTPEKFRFDFNHFESVNEDKLKEIEQKVNRVILSGQKVTKRVMPLDEAKAEGATALFGEKYKDEVRVVQVGGYSLELCGGCHVDNTSQIGLFKILSEGSVAAGIRRIEGVTGEGFLNYVTEQESVISLAAKALHSKPAEIADKAQALQNEVRAMQREIDKLRQKMAHGLTDELLAKAETIKGIKTIVSEVPGAGVDEMRAMGDKLKEKLDCGLIVLASANGDKVNFVAMATENAIKKGVHSGSIVREVAKLAGGGGGGKPDSAAAGGKDAAKMSEALTAVYDYLAVNIK
jgi:alanyl-tRNA synthetase